jgi:hypothetical protein
MTDMKSPVATLSDPQLSAYREMGFLEMRRPLLPPDRFAALKACFETLLDRYGPDDLDVIHAREPALLEFLGAREVLDLVERITGPNIGLWSSHFICKPPHVGRITPWHEDSAYWDGRLSTMDNIVTVWLAIDGTDRKNGAMGVVPGSHKGAQWPYERIDIGDSIFDLAIKPDALDLDGAHFFTLSPNEFSLHDARIVHGAEANRTPRRRVGYTMRYFPTSTKILPANGDHPVWLMRGEDLAGNVYVNK